MEIKLTLKQFITLLAFLIPAFVAQAQNYNNIEFIENKGQWDDRVKYKGDVNGGAIIYPFRWVYRITTQPARPGKIQFHGSSP